MSEHQLPEPDPEPLGAISLELQSERPEEIAEMDMLLFSIKDSIVFLINRNDGRRKTTRVFQEEKVLPLLEKSDAGKIKNQGQVCLYSYGYFGSKQSNAYNLYQSKDFNSEYSGRRLAGIDLIKPVADAGEEETAFLTEKYRIIVNEQKRPVLKRYMYNEQLDTEVSYDVDEDTIAEIGLLLQSLRGDA